MGLALREIHSAPPSTEQQLVTAVRAGEDRAFEELFSRYRRRISAYVYGLVGDYGRAEDITQEVFISALRRLRETDRPIAFRPWIYEIARNACIDEHRRTRRAALVSLDEQEGERGTQIPPMPDTGSPELRWERKQQLGHLFGAFSGLSEAHHQILVMRELEGLSYGEIGARLGMSRPVVESTLFRARRRLTQEFGELSSGQRCQEVRAAVDQEPVRALASRGIRERRRIAGHLEFCDSCLHYARAAGIDDTALRVPSVGRRVAALLPFGWLRFLRGGGSDSHSHPAAPSHAAWPTRLLHRALPVHRGAGGAHGLGRGATAAAVIVAGGMPAALIPMLLPAPGASAHHQTRAVASRLVEAAAPVPAQTVVPSSLVLAGPTSTGTGRAATGQAPARRPAGRRAGRRPASRAVRPIAGRASPAGSAPASSGAATGSSTPTSGLAIPATPALSGTAAAVTGAVATTTQVVGSTSVGLVGGTTGALAQAGQGLAQTAGQALTRTGQGLAQTGQALTTGANQAASKTAGSAVSTVQTTASQVGQVVAPLAPLLGSGGGSGPHPVP